MYSHIRIALIVFSGVCVTSCVNLGTAESRIREARKLSLGLQHLSPSVNADEADKMAATAVEQSASLSRSYKPVAMPWFNNFLINSGFRQRGLCYQWRNDLFPALFRLKAETLDLHLATSRKGSFIEHNALVVTAHRQPFAHGIILDPWRGSGNLWWGRFDQDPRHPWKKLTRDQTPLSLRPLLMPLGE